MQSRYKLNCSSFQYLFSSDELIIQLIDASQEGSQKIVAPPDQSGIPKNDVNFTLSIQIQCDTPIPYCGILFEWFTASDRIQLIQIGLIESFTTVQNTIRYNRTFDALRINDAFCTTLCNRSLGVHFMNEENIVQTTFNIDYSSLLLRQSFHYQDTNIRIMGVDVCKINIEADQPLLLDMYKHYLNPLMVEVIGAKDVPPNTQGTYQPAYVKYNFFEGKHILTNAVIGQNKLLWNHRHVFLLGLIDSAKVRQYLRGSYMKFELHDRDQVKDTKIKEELELMDIGQILKQEEEKEKPPEDPKKAKKKEPEKKQPEKKVEKKEKKKDAKLGEPVFKPLPEVLSNNYGLAAFHLTEFLKPSMRNTTYKAPVVPRNVFEDLESRNIDLNTTARNSMQKMISSNNYFDRNTVLLVGYTLSYPIGTFVKPLVAMEQSPDSKKKEKKGESKQPEIPQMKTQTQEESKKDVFQRVVYVIPYNDKDTLNKIEDIVYSTNNQCFRLQSRRQISTHLLNLEERQSSVLNYISGIQLIDPEWRMFILQGLEKCITPFYETLKKKAQMLHNQRVLHNSTLTFTNRLYAAFNIDIKRIRFRPNLSSILLNPGVYIQSVIPEDISLNLNRILNIYRLCHSLSEIESMGLWPQAESLIQIERKFSQSLSHLDIYAQPATRKHKDSSLETKSIINFMGEQTIKHFGVSELPLQEHKEQPQTQKHQFSQSCRKHVLTKTFSRDPMKASKVYNLQLQKAQVPDDQPVYIYACQKLNWYGQQMRQQREKIKQDPSHIYTTSQDYLGATIDPNTLEDQKKELAKQHMSRVYAEKPFQHVPKKTYEERMQHPKSPTKQSIDQLHNFPYYLQKQREQKLKRDERDMPLGKGVQEFKKYMKKTDYFGHPQTLETEELSPIQKMRHLKQKKLREEQAQRDKMLGLPFMKIKKTNKADKVRGIDKYTPILDSKPVKAGLIDMHKSTRKKRTVQNYGISLFQQQKPTDPGINPLLRKDIPSLNVSGEEFNNYQRPQILTLTQISKPLRRF